MNAVELAMCLTVSKLKIAGRTERTAPTEVKMTNAAKQTPHDDIADMAFVPREA